MKSFLPPESYDVLKRKKYACQLVFLIGKIKTCVPRYPTAMRNRSLLLCLFRRLFKRNKLKSECFRIGRKPDFSDLRQTRKLNRCYFTEEQSFHLSDLIVTGYLGCTCTLLKSVNGKLVELNLNVVSSERDTTTSIVSILMSHHYNMYQIHKAPCLLASYTQACRFSRQQNAETLTTQKSTPT